MKILINYANDKFKSSQKLNSKSGLEVGAFDKVISYSPKDIDNDFFQQNKSILSHKKGNGFWLWKPYFIKKTLEQLNEDDYLFYADSGSYFVRPIDPIIDICEETGSDIIAFEHYIHAEKVWTKRDAFFLMGCDKKEYVESPQRIGGFNLWKNTKFTIDFLNEFLEFATDERILTDRTNHFALSNYPGFKEHRHDQSIYSLLTKKYGITAYRDLTQWGNAEKQYYNDSNYKQIIQLTRRSGNFLYENN